MPCYTVADIPVLGPLLSAIPGVGGVNLTTPVTNAFINGLLSWREYEVYKDHRAKLNALATRNKEIARIAKGKNNEVEAKRASLYALLNTETPCTVCCDDVRLTVFSRMAEPFKAYRNQSEQLHYSQCGRKQDLLRKTLDAVPNAIAATAEAYNQEYKICEAVHQDYLRGITSSAYRGEVPNPAVLSELARNTADNLNDSSQLFSQFLNETTRSIGVQIANNTRISQATDVGLQSTAQSRPDLFNLQTQNPQQQPLFVQQQQPFQVTQPLSIYGDNNGSTQSNSP